MAESVQGIAGVFLRARDPDVLRAWYADQLGIEMEDYGTSRFDWATDQDGNRFELWQPA